MPWDRILEPRESVHCRKIAESRGDSFFASAELQKSQEISNIISIPQKSQKRVAMSFKIEIMIMTLQDLEHSTYLETTAWKNLENETAELQGSRRSGEYFAIQFLATTTTSRLWKNYST